ncbi:MAG: MraY family glycosyltransferase [Candidatus Omnitrophica bacterium]|nr:MraY family glycosyltransferase [Candidatus Omnitrophota bacterium]MDD5690496.1 MraY family glycosyltransferase [Candidatus Omnitrophota bacterium]
MSDKYLYIIPFFSFFLGIIIIFLGRTIFRHQGLTSKGISIVGGFSIGLPCLFTGALVLCFSGCPEKGTIGILTASLLMFIFGVIDDWHELSIGAKIATQAIAICLLVLQGMQTHIIYIGNIPNIAITFIWIIGITNAFNHLDIMDGLAGLVAFVINLAFFVTGYVNGNMHVVVLTLALGGALASFLIFNLPPAKIYMGNSGSHFLGFLLASMALMDSYAPLERPIALLAPLFILGLPILDTCFLIIIRIRQRRSPFRKSDDNLAIRFLNSGYSKKKTLLIMFSMAAVFSLLGLFFR